MNPIHVTHTPHDWQWECRLCGRTIRGYADPARTGDHGRNHVHRHPHRPSVTEPMPGWWDWTCTCGVTCGDHITADAAMACWRDHKESA